MEILESVVIENDLCLIIGAGDDVSDGPERRRDHFDVLVAQERHQVWHEAGVYDELKPRSPTRIRSAEIPLIE